MDAAANAATDAALDAAIEAHADRIARELWEECERWHEEIGPGWKYPTSAALVSFGMQVWISSHSGKVDDGMRREFLAGCEKMFDQLLAVYGREGLIH